MIDFIVDYLIGFIIEFLFDFSDSGMQSSKFSTEARTILGVIAVIFYLAIAGGFFVMGYFSLENSKMIAVFLFMLAVVFLVVTFKRIALIREINRS